MDVHPRIDNNRFWPIPTSKNADLWWSLDLKKDYDMDWHGMICSWEMMDDETTEFKCVFEKKWGNMKLRWFIIILSSANLDFWDNRIFAVPSCCKPRVADEACQRDFSPPGGSLHRRRHVDRESTNPESYIYIYVSIHIYHLSIYLSIYIYIYIYIYITSSKVNKSELEIWRFPFPVRVG